MVSKKLLSLCVLMVSAGSCLDTNAGVLSRILPASWSSKNRADALIVTGNFAKSRLLAELVQHKTKQPIVLVSPTAQGNAELYFIPAGREAMVVESSRYVEFVDFLNPRRVIVLGDEQFVPAKYLEELRGRYPTSAVVSSDWQKNAESMKILFGYRSLPRIYAACLAKLESSSGGSSATGAEGGGGARE